MSLTTGQTYVSNHSLQPTTHFGKQVFQDQTTGTILIHKDDAGNWEPVDHIDHDIGGKELMQSYGMWDDKEITKGHLFHKPDVIRPVDGVIQPDEVLPYSSGSQTATMADGKNTVYMQLQDIKISAPNSLGNALYQSQWIVTGVQPPVVML